MLANWIDDIPASFPSSLWLFNGAWCRWMAAAPTHTRTLPNFNSFNVAHTRLGGRCTHKLLCFHYLSQLLSHTNLHSGVWLWAPTCTIEHRQFTNKPSESWCWLSELSDGVHWSFTLIAIFCNCRNHVCTSLKRKCTRQGKVKEMFFRLEM